MKNKCQKIEERIKTLNKKVESGKFGEKKTAYVKGQISSLRWVKRKCK